MVCPIQCLLGAPHLLVDIFILYLEDYKDFASCKMVCKQWKSALDCVERGNKSLLKEKRFTYDWIVKDLQPRPIVIDHKVDRLFDPGLRMPMGDRSIRRTAPEGNTPLSV